MNDFLRPDFDRVPALRFRAEQILVAMERLTEEQYDKLDLVEVTDRLMCEGGAGTGKTFLAAEVARREVARGNRVLVTCQSATLAAFLRRRLTHGMITVTPLDATTGSERFDVVVVDEGQDLLDFDRLGRLDALIEGGLEHGRWRFFYDANNQSSLFRPSDPDAVVYMRSLATAAGGLHANCRNTTEIVLQTRLLTAADLGTPTAGHGPAVEYRYYDSESDQASLLDRQLRWLRDEDVAPGEVTVLTGREEPGALVAQLPPRWGSRLRRLDAKAAGEWPVPETTIARIDEFKGLENQFICLVDLASVGATDHDRSLLYVAMSRARAGLWIALDKRLKAHVEQAAARNLEAVIEGVSRDRA